MISEDEFWNDWGVITAPEADFFTLDTVQEFPLNYVWTVVDSRNNCDWYAMPGYHIVNRTGYIVTRKPWDDPTLDAIYYIDRIP